MTEIPVNSLGPEFRLWNEDAKMTALSPELREAFPWIRHSALLQISPSASNNQFSSENNETQKHLTVQLPPCKETFFLKKKKKKRHCNHFQAFQGRDFKHMTDH